MMKNKHLIILGLIILMALTSCKRFDQAIRTEVLPEDELYAIALEKFNQQAWDDAIAAFDRFERLYVNSDKIQDVRLMRADAQFNRGRTSGYISAKAEYQQFIALYPNYEREDYLWFQIANCSLQQMLPENRDQTATREAIEDLEVFLNRFPDSQYAPEAREKLNSAYERLAKYHVVVGDHYYGRGIYASAALRYMKALEMNVTLESLRDVLYKLTISLSRSATGYYSSFKAAENATVKQEELIELYKGRYQESQFNARKYLGEYKASFPGDSDRIRELTREVDQIPKDVSAGNSAG